MRHEIDNRNRIVHTSSNNQKHLCGEEEMRMVGNIRTEEKCPRCGGVFTHDLGKGLLCEQCMTRPIKYYLDIPWKGKRCRIFRDRSGDRFEGYSKAYKLFVRINEEIEQKTFDPTYYTKSDQARYQFSQYAKTWYSLTSDQNAPGTRKIVRYYLDKYLVPYFGNQDIRTLRSGDVVKFHKSLVDLGLNGTTRRNIVVYLKAIFRKAWDWEDIAKVPVFPEIATEERPFKWIDRETQLKVLNQVATHHHPILKFLFMTGCRIAEATALKWDCVDFEGRVITIKRTHSMGELRETTKTKKGWRHLYLTDELLFLLQSQYSSEKKLEGGWYVFLTLKGRHYTTGVLSKVWRKVCKKMGVEISLYNATRHSFASQRVNAGFSLDQIGTVLGHSTSEMTKRYARVLTENLKEVMEGKKNNVSVLPSANNRQ